MSNLDEKVVDLKEQESCSNNQTRTNADKPAEKPVYKKPELRKYTQIDYVTAYGVD